MDIRSLARNAARSEHLRCVRRRSRPAAGKQFWTPAQQDKIKLLFPDRRALEKALPDRTWIAIRSHAGVLGLRKKHLRWLACDLSKLQRMWIAGASPKELVAALPKYDWQQIRKQAQGRQFRRPQRPATATGFSVIDQIKQRLRDLNLSLGDLDAIAGTKRYFYSHEWRHGHINVLAVGKAILALDGEITAVWRAG